MYLQCPHCGKKFELPTILKQAMTSFNQYLGEEVITPETIICRECRKNSQDVVQTYGEKYAKALDEFAFSFGLDQDLSEQEIVRRSKMYDLRRLGLDPFGQKFNWDSHAQDIISKYQDKTIEELESLAPHVIVAGRIMTNRRQGKNGFMHIQDKTGEIQIYLRFDVLGEEMYSLYKMADIGDIVGIEGTVMKTIAGELSIKAEKYTHLCKALRPLPEKFHGLQDKEEARRRRYVDLIMNDNAKKIAFARPKIIRGLQKFLDDQGFVEVETPVLNPILGGANARPFVTHHNALDKDFYLRIATELYLKRLIVGGMERVYEVGRLFRNEGMDATHNPEFTTVEAYMAYGDLSDMMTLNENLFDTLANQVCGTTEIEYCGKQISLKAPFRRLHMVDAVKEATGIDFWKITDLETALALAKEHHIDIPAHEMTVGHIINEFFEKYVEDTLIQPTFVYGHPVEISPLTKKNKENPRFVDRFELYVAGHEYSNAYTELNDPVDQRARFLEQLKEKELGNDEANEMDYDFLEALEYGMAPTGGIGIGIDRLVMLLTDCETIRDVLLFPHMKDRNQ
jgi:lysyl-tRNA synthetase class 2